MIYKLWLKQLSGRVCLCAVAPSCGSTFTPPDLIYALYFCDGDRVHQQQETVCLSALVCGLCTSGFPSVITMPSGPPTTTTAHCGRKLTFQWHAETKTGLFDEPLTSRRVFSSEFTQSDLEEEQQDDGFYVVMSCGNIKYILKENMSTGVYLSNTDCTTLLCLSRKLSECSLEEQTRLSSADAGKYDLRSLSKCGRGGHWSTVLVSDNTSELQSNKYLFIDLC